MRFIPAVGRILSRIADEIGAHNVRHLEAVIGAVAPDLPAGLAPRAAARKAGAGLAGNAVSNGAPMIGPGATAFAARSGRVVWWAEIVHDRPHHAAMAG